MQHGTRLARTARKRDPDYTKHYFGGFNTHQDKPGMTWLHGAGFLCSNYMKRNNCCWFELGVEYGTRLARTAQGEGTQITQNTILGDLTPTRTNQE